MRLCLVSWACQGRSQAPLVASWHPATPDGAELHPFPLAKECDAHDYDPDPQPGMLHCIAIPVLLLRDEQPMCGSSIGSAGNGCSPCRQDPTGKGLRASRPPS